MEKSIFPKEMMSNNSLTIESIAGKLFYFEIQYHLLHWQTASIAEHECVAGAYEYIHSFTDGLVEKLMGYGNKKPSYLKIDPIISTTSLAVTNELLSFAKELKKFGETNEYLDVCNLADSLSGEAASIRYKLTLS